MRAKKDIKLVLDSKQLSHIIRSYFGFTVGSVKIDAISNSLENLDCVKITDCPILVVRATEEVEI